MEFLEALSKQVLALCSAKGVSDLCQSIRANPLAIVLLIGLVIKFFNSGPIKDVEGTILNGRYETSILYIGQLYTFLADFALVLDC